MSIITSTEKCYICKGEHKIEECSLYQEVMDYQSIKGSGLNFLEYCKTVHSYGRYCYPEECQKRLNAVDKYVLYIFVDLIRLRKRFFCSKRCVDRFSWRHNRVFGVYKRLYVFYGINDSKTRQYLSEIENEIITNKYKTFILKIQPYNYERGTAFIYFRKLLTDCW